MKNEVFVSHKNRGMLLEKIINKTINYYNSNKIAFFAKKNLDIKFSSIKDGTSQLKNSFICKKSTVDYYGIFKSKYVTFEAKSTDDDVFNFSNIKEHQHKHLLLVKELGGIAFYLIMFKKHSQIFLVDVDEFSCYKKRSISFNEAKQLWISVDIIFPGIVDFLSVL